MATITEILLTDLKHDGDLSLASGTGDLATISGLDNIRQALYHRLVTTPGSLAHRPEYGCGLKRFQGAPNTVATQRQIAGIINEQFKRDPRIESVTSTQILFDDVSPEKVTIIVAVKLVGYGDTELKFLPFGEPV